MERNTIYNKKMLRAILDLPNGLELDLLVKATGYTWTELNKTRKREKIVWKQILMGYLYMKGLTYFDIGEKFNKHHSSVIYSVGKLISLATIKDPLTTVCLNKLKSLHRVSLKDSTTAEKIFSKHYTNGTSYLLDYDTRVELDWMVEAIKEALDYNLEATR